MAEIKFSFSYAFLSGLALSLFYLNIEHKETE